MTNPFKGVDFENMNNKPETKETVEENIVTEETENSPEVEENIEVANETNTELEKVRADYEQLNNQYIRLAADFENYRKRQENERENLIKYGAMDTLKKLLEVLDRGEKALENVEDCQIVKDSFNKVHKQTMDVLTKLGLEVIETEGKEFDPNFHEAVMQTPTSEHPDNTIVNELQKGYKLGDKVLRPSLVNVAVAE